MAYLDIQRRGKTYICGGFLVAENFVLTAAHCNGEEQEQSQQTISVCHRIPHPQYNKESTNNDIMLLQAPPPSHPPTPKRAKLNRWGDTISLPRASETVETGAMCSVAGWGGTSTDCTSTPARLQEVDVLVMQDAACPGNPNGPYCYYNASSMMCVGDPKTGKDSWKGDSGGPLVCGETAQSIVSWGPPNPPGVYMKITTFIPCTEAMLRRLQP
ncbi:Mast cell protease 3 [Chelonia mydas]|uniref:Mast cell protease 3 n=1 Tax=Chelonia mydas TaxID=8469 RepID=M7B3Z5_CHEMY|nr:Mast cell protease 3 [Chelonia mydas]